MPKTFFVLAATLSLLITTAAQAELARKPGQNSELLEMQLPPGSVMKTAILTYADGTQETVEYAKTPDGQAIMSGDILIHVDDHGRAWIAKEFDRLWFEQAQAEPDLDTKATGTSNLAYRWSNNTVPYVISISNSAQRALIEAAMAHVEDRTAVRFVPRTNQYDYVNFIPGTGCGSPVGRQGGPQPISLSSSCSFGSTVHEISHALGLFHEQQRMDRDQSIIVHWSNIKPDKHSLNFDKRSGFYRCPFDFNSIMLYSSYAPSDFAINPFQPILTRLDGSTWTANRTALSGCDSGGIDDMYRRVRASIYVQCTDFLLTCDFYSSSQYGVQPVTSWRWTIEDWPNTVIRTTPVVSYQFQSPGQHYVSLEIVDSQGDRATAMVMVDLDPSDPCLICP